MKFSLWTESILNWYTKSVVILVKENILFEMFKRQKNCTFAGVL